MTRPPTATGSVSSPCRRRSFSCQPTGRGSTATSFGSAAETLIVSEATVEALKRLSADSGTTLFGTLLTAYYVLLHRLSGQDDIVVGISSSGQSLMGREDVVGHCVNFLPDSSARGGHAGRPTPRRSRRAAGRLRSSELHVRPAGAIAQARPPTRTDAAPERDLQHGSEGQRRWPSATFARPSVACRNVVRTSTCSLMRCRSTSGLRLDCTYLTDLYDAETVRRWLGSYECVLQAHPCGPDASRSPTSR